MIIKGNANIERNDINMLGKATSDKLCYVNLRENVRIGHPGRG